ncbi:hypothetical protein ACIA03_28045 [Nocardioides sp. NPDC051685]|uniref:hypothetical protein n=1 Tax=Nocardioides sp. NPDC051685 TaxID=3364334 RepID=UPI0037ACCCF6
MHVTLAQHPEPPSGDDRAFVTSNAVIVLDGASAFAARDVPASTYAEHLGSTMAALIDGSDEPLTALLADAIKTTATALDLRPGGRAPSSTVAVVRRRADATTDVLVLGDSQVVTPDEVIRDDRLGPLASTERTAYRTRLEQGHGYDDEHRRILAALQTEQLRHRNKPGGYWIAEADPAAAEHALTRHLLPGEVPWCVLATDGAYKPMEHLGLDEWPAVAAASADDLDAVLQRCQDWESTDAQGEHLPRAKCHDDKTLAVVVT